jgi:hypothetical protein
VLAVVGLVILEILALNDSRYISPRSSSEVVARFLEREAKPGDLIVTIPDSIAVSINYYLPAQYDQIDLPELERVDRIDFAGWPQRFEDRLRWRAFSDRLTKAASSGRPLWLIFSPAVIHVPDNRSATELAATMLPDQAAMAEFAIHTIQREYNVLETHGSPSAYEPMIVTRWIPKQR